MRPLLFLLILICPAVVLFAQEPRNWKPYKPELSKVVSVQMTHTSVVARISSIRTDSVMEKGNIVLRRTFIERTQNYTMNGTINVDVKATTTMGFVNKAEERSEITIDTDLGTIKDSSLPFPKNSANQCGTPVEASYSFKKDTVYLNRNQLRNIFDKYYFNNNLKQIRFYFGFNFSPQASYRMVLVNQADFNDPARVDLRDEAERVSLGYVVSVPFGITVGRKSTFYAEYIHVRQGFKSDNAVMDWNTGFSNKSAGYSNYSFVSNGLGLGFMYASATGKISTVTDAGVSALWLHRYRDASNTVYRSSLVSNPVTTGLKRRVFEGKFGIGASFRIRNEWAIRMIPTFYFGLTPINRRVLTTKLLGYGLTTGICFQNKKNHGKVSLKRNDLKSALYSKY